MHGNKRYLKPCKKVQLTLKTPRLYSIYRCIEKKYFLWKRLGLDLIFTRQDFISCDLICRNFMAAPILFQEKKHPRNKKLRSLFQLTFYPLKTSENWNFFTKCFISVFPGFFQETLFRWLFLTFSFCLVYSDNIK